MTAGVHQIYVHYQIVHGLLEIPLDMVKIREAFDTTLSCPGPVPCGVNMGFEFRYMWRTRIEPESLSKVYLLPTYLGKSPGRATTVLLMSTRPDLPTQK